MVAGHDQFVIEQKTSIFKLFMDLDIRIAESNLSRETMQSVVNLNLVREGVNAFYLGEYELIVCTRPTTEEEAHKFKSGTHLIWPTVFTNRHTMQWQ